MTTENLIKRLSAAATALLQRTSAQALDNADSLSHHARQTISDMLSVMQAIQADRKAVIAHNKKLQKEIDKLKAKQAKK